MRAEALDDLASRPYYRPPHDSYPGFNASEIEPQSSVVARGRLYRSDWSSGVDAVSAVLMRSRLHAEYVLDTPTRSSTEFVVTMPTRPLQTTTTGFSAPFRNPSRWFPRCRVARFPAEQGEELATVPFDREERMRAEECGEQFGVCIRDALCATSAAGVLRNGRATQPDAILGSVSRGFGDEVLASELPNGTLVFAPSDRSTGQAPALTSMPTSQRIDMATGTVMQGPHTFRGLPMVGFVIHTYRSGALYFGGAYPMKGERSISP
jgi:hypothetical protein